MNLKERAKQIKRDIPAVFLAMKHPDTPQIAKVLAAIAVCDALSPIDLIPDFIPVLGYLDDVLLLPLLITAAIRCIPPEVMQACRTESQEMWTNGRPKKWQYAIPVIVVWLLVLLWVLRMIF